MISDSGYDPDLAGGRGGYVLGSFQGGPDPNAGRDAIVQAVLAQQGVQPPQGQGMNDARGPDQGAPYRQAIGQGWSVEGNNVFDPYGNIVGRHGLQQYGSIPGVTQQTRGGGFSIMPPVGSSLSGGMAPGTTTTSPVGPGDFNSDVDISSQGGKGEFAMGGKTMADLPSSGSLFAPGEFGFHAGGGFTGPFSPSFGTPASPPTGEPADPVDFDTMGEREASLSTPSGSFDAGGMGGFGGGDFGGGFGGFGGFDAGGMGLDTAGGVG